jgi:spore coat polysaccharide biosynthesis protein SpsF
MGSQRLPGKSLALIDGVPLVTVCLRRLLASRVGPVVLATTVAAEDDVLVNEAVHAGVSAVRGSCDDVLGRFVQVVHDSECELVIRATADNPAIDVDGLQRVVDAAERLDADYCCERGLPLGAAVEVVRRQALLDAAAEATRADDREHVTAFVRRHKSRYRVEAPYAPEAFRRPHLRLTVDTEADLAVMRALSATVPGGLAAAAFADIISAAEALRAGTEVIRA